MAQFRCRMVRPKQGPWREVEGDSPEDAASTFHALHTEGSCMTTRNTESGSGFEKVHFARVEVEDHGELIVRTFESGIWRRGGVSGRATLTPEQVLERIAKTIGYEEDPANLLSDDDWEGAETLDEAILRVKAT